MTSSPEPMPSASSTRTRASVPLATPTVSGTSRYAAASRSNAATFGPRMNSPLTSTPSIASRRRGKSGSYCAFTSTSGIGRTASKSRRPPSPNDHIDHDRHNSRNRRVVDEPEVPVEGLVAPAGAPTHARERKTPDRRADQRQHGVAPEGHPEDAGRNGDERAHHGRHPPQEHGKLVPAVEPALGALQLVAAEVQPPPALLQQGPAAVEADRPAADGAHQVAERAGERHHHISPEVGRDPRPEEVDVLPGERRRGQRTRVDHDELARRWKHGVDRHQEEDGVDAVVSDQRGEGARDAGDRHFGGGYRRRRNGAVSSTAPTSFVAVTLRT